MILAEPVEAYLDPLHTDTDPVLEEMRAHAERDRIPIVQAPTGALLEVLAAAGGAQRVVEVGTAIGVSTLHLARGTAAREGTVVTFEIDAARQAAARDYLTRAGVIDRVDLRLEDAGVGLAAIEPPVDLAFVDGPKLGYREHVDTLISLLRPGGLLLVDNVLMSGTVATEEPDEEWSSTQIAAIRDLNSYLRQHPDLVSAITPVGDGVALAVRRGA